MQSLDDPLLREIQEAITAELRARSLLGEDAVRILIRALAQSQAAATFEKVYREILGSQLRALAHANSQNGVPREAVEFFYTQTAINHPDAYRNFPFTQWLSFLLRSVLLREDAEGRFHITVRGRTFLAYLAQAGLSMEKFF